MKNTESGVVYFEVDAVLNREPVELLEESMWTAGLRRTGNDTRKECVLSGVWRVFLCGSKWSVCCQVLTPTFNVASDLLMALDLNDGFQYLPKLWSGMCN